MLVLLLSRLRDVNRVACLRCCQQARADVTYRLDENGILQALSALACLRCVNA